MRQAARLTDGGHLGGEAPTGRRRGSEAGSEAAGRGLKAAWSLGGMSWRQGGRGGAKAREMRRPSSQGQIPEGKTWSQGGPEHETRISQGLADRACGRTGGRG